MIHDILQQFPKHQVKRIPKVVRLPIIGAVRLPVWLTYEYDFISPKGTHYTLYGMAWKFRHKLAKKARKINAKIQNPYTDGN